MPLYRKTWTITASSTQTLSLGRIYGNASFFRISGTGSGAIKLAIKSSGGHDGVFVKPSPNRIGLLADDPPQKFVAVPFDALKFWASGTTAATVRVHINCWELPANN